MYQLCLWKSYEWHNVIRWWSTTSFDMSDEKIEILNTPSGWENVIKWWAFLFDIILGRKGWRIIFLFLPICKFGCSQPLEETWIILVILLNALEYLWISSFAKGYQEKKYIATTWTWTWLVNSSFRVSNPTEIIDWLNLLSIWIVD